MPEHRSFLDSFDYRPWEPSRRRSAIIRGYILGGGNPALQVLVGDWPEPPGADDLRSLWKERTQGRPFPLLVVGLHGDIAAICGPIGEDPPARLNLDPGQVERLCEAALREPNKEAAIRYLGPALAGLEGPTAGVRNEGLFATHELINGVPARHDWTDAGARSRRALRLRGRALLEALGFTIEPLQGPSWLLKSGDHDLAVAVFLDRGESPDLAHPAYSEMSPVSYALARADDRNVPWVIVASGSALRIHPTDPTKGVGRRGRTDTFLELQLDLLSDERAGYLWLLFAAENLEAGGAFAQILENSGRFAGDLGERLRDRIYEKVVPGLAQALMRARGLRKVTAARLAETYEAALLLLFRLLFLAYAEDRDLLPYRVNGLYRKRSIKEMARELLELERNAPAAFGAGSDYWQRLRSLFTAVREGNRGWGVPPYGGAIFEVDADLSPLGALLEGVELPDTALGPILQSLLLDDTEEGRGPVDFRSLGVREFGTIYEGLLEQELSLAESDLAIDKEGAYVPVKGKARAVVTEGQVYLHNTSGSRKASGSYYTKSFAVDHLLDHALEPALAEHCARLDTLGEDEAAAAFFRFHTADIAMGSGHFLVAAIDRVEGALARYLAKRRLPGVMDELQRLRAAALAALGPLAEGTEIEDTQLLRRQIARRCIYGVDLNPKAVLLARLSVWIHTFVPGLPLSFLDRGLIEGNSLVGIATFDEAQDLLTGQGGSTGTLFSLPPATYLRKAVEPLERLARISDATRAEVASARKAWRQAEAAVEPAHALFDVLTASRLDTDFRREVLSAVEAHGLLGKLATLPDAPLHRKARRLMQAIPPFHFPIAFPEVFLKERPGFDVILGNPPWEKTQVEEHGFWARYVPGFRGLTQTEREKAYPKLKRSRVDLVELLDREESSAQAMRHVLLTGPYPGMGSGHPDLYKAFTWRFWHLLATPGGQMGVVLPRSAVAARGSAEFRLALLEDGTFVDVTLLLNNRKWVFAEVHPQYTIALVTVRKEKRPDPVVPLHGPYASHAEYVAGCGHGHVTDGRAADGAILARPEPVPVAEIQSWSEGAAFPLLPRADSLGVFRQLRKLPRFDQPPSQARPVQGDLNSTTGKPLMVFTERPGHWPVFKGESFDLWSPDSGSYYAWADSETICTHLQEKRLRQARQERSAFSEFSREVIEDPGTLPCCHPRIAFRRITRATDSRTMRAALVPSRCILVDTAPFLTLPAKAPQEEAYLLGVLCSLSLDWFARRFVETHMDFHVLNPLPVPRPRPDSPLRARAIALAGRLACPDRRFAKWAKAVGVDCGPLADDEKEDMIRELDAVVALLYGLTEPQLVHIFETFHVGWAHEEPLRATLKHFHAWRGRG